jgi:hypothetical protein
VFTAPDQQLLALDLRMAERCSLLSCATGLERFAFLLGSSDAEPLFGHSDDP